MGPTDVTADWIAGVLGTDVRSVACERIGDGLVGLNLRVSVELADPNADAPGSVVLKLPSLDATSRATGVALRNYEREVKFYTHIADTVDIRVPTCHHADWDETTGDFVLVLEDMAPAEQGDQIAGCEPDRALDAVRELARLHGPRWNDESLGDHEFLGRRSGPDDAAELVGLWSMFIGPFTATYGRHLDEDLTRVLDGFGPRLADWVDGRDGPTTVTHGDYRLDNLLFATPAGGPPVTAVDWQTPGHGPPVADLAYFCGAGLLPEARRAADHTLLEAYLQGLVEYGIEVEPDWAWEQYRREAFAGVIMAVVASQIVGGSDRSEAMFAAMATRHLQHAADLDSLELLT